MAIRKEDLKVGILIIGNKDGDGSDKRHKNYIWEVEVIESTSDQELHNRLAQIRVSPISDFINRYNLYDKMKSYTLTLWRYDLPYYDIYNDDNRTSFSKLINDIYVKLKGK